MAREAAYELGESVSAALEATMNTLHQTIATLNQTTTSAQPQPHTQTQPSPSSASSKPKPVFCTPPPASSSASSSSALSVKSPAPATPKRATPVSAVCSLLQIAAAESMRLLRDVCEQLDQIITILNSQMQSLQWLTESALHLEQKLSLYPASPSHTAQPRTLTTQTASNRLLKPPTASSVDEKHSTTRSK